MYNCVFEKRYMDLGVLEDPLVIHTDPAVKPFLALQEEMRPHGFQEWRTFGAPPGAPGPARHHPAVKEHEFIAWIIAMHLLSAMEVLALELLTEHTSRPLDGKSYSHKVGLPPPLLPLKGNAISLFHGISGGTNHEGTHNWTMRNIQCRTSFEKIVKGSIEEIVVGGTSGDGLDLMLPKGHLYYNKGWVMDLGEAEKKAKLKLERYGGLGYQDVKKSYYGIKASGALRLLLPHGSIKRELKDTDDALYWFKSLVVCEVNERRGGGECILEQDVQFVVGGIIATNVRYIDEEGVSYLGKKICVTVDIPLNARVTPSGSLTVDISVLSNKVTLKTGACSVSHVVWEELEHR
jgi:hypothetical protein